MKTIINKLILPLCVFLLLCSASQLFSENRIALVIGNSEYQDFENDLKNPGNDAADISEVLIRLGFDVELMLDLSLRDMKKAINVYKQKLEEKDNTVGVFFYAGHAVQSAGYNYLIPTGSMSNITNESDLEFEAVALGYLTNALSIRNNNLNIVILDACRNNPFRNIFTTRGKNNNGLAAINSKRGTLIAYATSPGEVAKDGTGKNSPFSKYLKKYLEQPCLKIEDVFKRVGLALEKDKETLGQQIPWYSSSIFIDFYLKEECANQQEMVTFHDDNFKKAVRSLIKKPEGDISKSDVDKIKSLNLAYKEIENISGIEHFKALKELQLQGNDIVDISPLTNLEALSFLELSNNQITDIIPLSQLMNLKVLGLSQNQISYIAPLSNLKNLEYLFLDSNVIHDIKPLARLSDLENLSLFDNKLKDISSLSGLTNLFRLFLHYNQISDLEPLSSLYNLGHLTLSHNQVSDIKALSGLYNLITLYMQNNQINDLGPLTNLFSLKKIMLAENLLSPDQKDNIINALPDTTIDFSDSIIYYIKTYPY